MLEMLPCLIDKKVVPDKDTVKYLYDCAQEVARRI